MKTLQILVSLFIGAAVSYSAPSDAPRFSSRTEAGIAAWNKLNPRTPASEDLRIAIQGLETASGELITFIQEINIDALKGNKYQRSEFINKLKSLNLYSIQLLSAIEQYKKQIEVELKRTRSSESEQQQIIQSMAKSFTLMRNWASAATQAAEAGIALSDFGDQGLTVAQADEHFTETWNALAKIQEAILQRAGNIQKKTDEIIRK